MAQKVFDSFDEANNTALTDHSPNLGGPGNWTAFATAGVFGQILGSTDVLRTSANGGTARIGYSPPTAPATKNQDIILHVSQLAGSAGSALCGMGRIAAADTMYGMSIYPAGDNVLRIWKMVAGVRTVLQAPAVAGAIDTFYMLELRDGSQRLLSAANLAGPYSPIATANDNDGALDVVGHWGLGMGSWAQAGDSIHRFNHMTEISFEEPDIAAGQPTWRRHGGLWHPRRIGRGF
ncbi:MAG: hypothetical protein MI806_26005 [Minwuiales bacterium]|nr:hypothetical protein [Minwuiales bacterium]